MEEVGYRDDLLPELVPSVVGADWHGIRVNLEMFMPESLLWTLFGSPRPTNNLQTFLIVQGGGTDVPGLAGVDPESATSAPSAREGSATNTRTLDAMRRLRR